MKTTFPAALAALVLASSRLLAAETAESDPAPDKPAAVSDAVDEVLSLHKAGVEPAVIIGHLRGIPALPRLSAADIVELKKNSVSPDVMSALILMSVPDKARLSADDIVQLHAAGVPSDIISTMITKARKTTESAARTAAQATAKPNDKYLLVMPRRSSVLKIPHRTHYYSPHVRGNYHGERYYGPTWSYGFYGYGRPWGW